MKNFLKGLVIGSIGLAVIQNLVQVINGCGDLAANKLQIKALKDQKEATIISKEIEKLSCDCETPSDTQCIGFAIPEEPESEYEYEEDRKGAKKRK